MSGYATPPDQLGDNTTFVYRPGAPPGSQPPIYPTWAALYADYSAGDGPVTIEIDDSIVSPAVIPAGAYTFRSDTVLSGSFADATANGTMCELADGVTFDGISQIDNALNLRSMSSAPIITITAPTIIALNKGSIIRAGGTAPFILNATEVTTGFIFMVLLNGGRIETDAERVIRLEDPLLAQPSVLAFVLLDGGEVQDDTFESGGGNVLVLPNLLGDSALFSYTQPNFTTTNPINATFVQETRNYWVVTDIKTGLYTASAGELVRCDPSGGTFTVTLPLAAETIPGSWVVVKNVTDDATPITVETVLADTIDGVASPGAYIIAAARGVATFVVNGSSDWIVVT